MPPYEQQVHLYDYSLPECLQVLEYMRADLDQYPLAVLMGEVKSCDTALYQALCEGTETIERECRGP